MNKQLVFASVLMAAALTGIFSTNPMAVYADRDYDDDDDHDDDRHDGDSSETNTEQKIKQKNVGGDGASQFNCAQNNLNEESTIDVDACGTVDVGVGGEEALGELLAPLGRLLTPRPM